jgi:hypothetical protein
VTEDERADLAEAMVPEACDLACLVRDGDADGIARFLAALHPGPLPVRVRALLVVLAAMVPVEDASPNQLLEWTGGLEAALEWRQEVLPFPSCRCTELEPCGTYAAWARHVRRSEPVDAACERAMRAYKLGKQRDRTARIAAAGERDAA